MIESFSRKIITVSFLKISLSFIKRIHRIYKQEKPKEAIITGERFDFLLPAGRKFPRTRDDKNRTIDRTIDRSVAETFRISGDTTKKNNRGEGGGGKEEMCFSRPSRVFSLPYFSPIPRY